MDDLWSGDADRNGSMIFEANDLLVDSSERLTDMADMGYGIAVLDENEEVQSCCALQLIEVKRDYWALLNEVW